MTIKDLLKELRPYGVNDVSVRICFVKNVGNVWRIEAWGHKPGYCVNQDYDIDIAQNKVIMQFFFYAKEFFEAEAEEQREPSLIAISKERR